MAFNLAEKLNLKHTFNKETQKAGYDWLRSFFSRNPNLSVRKAESVLIPRPLGMNKPTVMKYFDLLEHVLTTNNIIGKPGNVFTMDETGLQLNNKPGHVVAIKGSKNVTSITSGERGETISVLTCCNGEGMFLPPFCIFKGKNKKEEYSDDMPPGAEIKMSEKSSYVNADIFLDWLKNHFTPRKPSGKVLLILSGHTSQTNCIETLEFAEKYEIIMISLPPHTTHYLQPLDRSFFKSLKENYNIACNNFIKNNPSRKITRLQFGSLLNFAWTKSTTVQNGISGFKATGIIPLNRHAVPEYAFLVRENDVDG
ncbi:Jerky protein homolog-like [Habropoda laboriosa]|uniref:Jerky protein homolog-like n=1 Tax=Habropoda laboriosa TaxID=597456 RepID=A0A0L7QLJ6_9HYME|nr:Jerky protein homolog-like [Habropoda laboriosa]